MPNPIVGAMGALKSAGGPSGLANKAIDKTPVKKVRAFTSSLRKKKNGAEKKTGSGMMSLLKMQDL